MTRGRILLLAVASGVAVGNLYFPQSVSPSIASGLDTTPAAATLVVPAVQFGYAAGIFLLVPLGDRMSARMLLGLMFAATGIGLFTAGRAPGLALLVATSALIGITTTAAQVIAPFAAGQAPAQRRGTVLGLLLSGSTAGILAGRVAGGAAADWVGWRAVYTGAAALALAMAGALVWRLPRTAPPAREGRYVTLLAAPLGLLKREGELQRSCFYQATVFASFSAVWTGVALLLTGPTYGFTTHAVGLLGVVDVAVLAAAPLAGHLSDRIGSDPVNVAAMGGALVAGLVLLAGTAGGTGGLVALAAGALLLDVCMQSGMVANHNRIFALSRDARSRLNTAYMTCVFLGGALGSWTSTRAYALGGWTGVCLLVVGLSVLGLAGHAVHRRRARTAARVRA
jgi:predicted MFS family arabinose efflux permease